MDVIVLVKRVPDPEAQIEVKGDGTGVAVEERYVMNFFDNLAVEEAIRIKEKVGGKVTAITLGPPSSVEVLRTALAMGVDEAILVEDEAFQGEDEFATARVLAKVVESLPHDLILCGREAFDDSSGIVGSLVGKFLGLPVVTMITKLEVYPEEGRVEVERDVEEGREVLSVSLPAVLTAQKGLNEPRVPSVMGVMKAMKAPIKKLNLRDVGLKPQEVGKEGSKLEIRRFLEVRKERKVRYIKGEPEVVVKELVELLKSEAKVL